MEHGHHATSRATAQTALGSWGLLLALLLLMLGNGLLGTLLGVRAGIAGFSVGLTGFILAGYYVGFLAGAWAIPRFVGSVGHIRVYAALASLASTAALLHAVVDSPVVWWVLRIISGFSQAGLYIVAESWLNDSATNENRGRLLSIYMIVIMGGLGLGQLLLSVADPGAATLFIISSVLVSLAVVPVTLSVGKAPDFHWTERLPVRKIWEAAPAGLIGGLGAGFTNGAVIALGAVYGTETGMSVDRIAVFMGLLVIGAVVLQWPVGVVSDRMRRRRAILLITMLAAALATLGAVVDPLGAGMLVVIFVFGGTTFPLYSLSLSHINDHAPPGSAIAVSAVFVFISGIGAILGPLLTSVAMSVSGPSALFWTLAVVHTAIGVFVAVRIAVRRGLPVGAQRRHLHVPARAGALIVSLTHRRRGEDGRRHERPGAQR